MKCCWDGTIESCQRCTLPDCIRNDIDDDPAIKESYADKDNALENELYGEPTGKRRYGHYKGTYFDDEVHKKKREYARRRRLGLPPVKKEYKRKGREIEYQRERRAQMSEEQKERYRAWQREYARKKRAKIA